MDADELIQEAWFVLNRICTKYADATIAQTVALYKRSLLNEFHRLADKSSRTLPSASEDDDDVDGYEIPTPASPDTILDAVMRAPRDMRHALECIITADSCDITNERKSANRLSYNEMFSALTGGNPTIATEMREYLRHANDPR